MSVKRKFTTLISKYQLFQVTEEKKHSELYLRNMAAVLLETKFHSLGRYPCMVDIRLTKEKASITGSK